MARRVRLALMAGCAALLTGCGVTTVVGAAAGAAISVTGAVVTTGVKLTGKAVGAGIDALSPTERKPVDTSGIVVRESIRSEATMGAGEVR